MKRCRIFLGWIRTCCCTGTAQIKNCHFVQTASEFLRVFHPFPFAKLVKTITSYHHEVDNTRSHYLLQASMHSREMVLRTSLTLWVPRSIKRQLSSWRTPAGVLITRADVTIIRESSPKVVMNQAPRLSLTRSPTRQSRLPPNPHRTAGDTVPYADDVGASDVMSKSFGF